MNGSVCLANSRRWVVFLRSPEPVSANEASRGTSPAPTKSFRRAWYTTFVHEAKRTGSMSTVSLDEDSVDEILYLARANEASELSAFLDALSTQTQHSKVQLLAAAVDPYTKNTALHYAAANGHNGMRTPSLSPTPIIIAMFQMYELTADPADIIKLLLSLHTDKATTSASVAASGLINAVNDAGNTALHWAALNGHLHGVKSLVESGADVTMINKAGHDAVFEAEINDKSDVVEWLLGAVEALEKGIGEEGEISVAAGDLGGEADKRAAGGVEDVRRQMEDLQTKDATAQGG
jgi:hypothetical protein